MVKAHRGQVLKYHFFAELVVSYIGKPDYIFHSEQFKNATKDLLLSLAILLLFLQESDHH